MKREVVALCGSTRFRDEFREVERALTLEGKIPLPPAIYGKAEGMGDYPEKVAKHLFDLHLDKINMSDSIFVIDVGGYMGGSTQKEIYFAKKHGKPVRYYSREKDDIKETLKQLGAKR
jgi:hypothetical protein